MTPGALRPARGDRRPCDAEGCGGMMQYRRPETTLDGNASPLQWVCELGSRHALYASLSEGLAGALVNPRT